MMDTNCETYGAQISPVEKLRFYKKINIPENEDDCWEWTAYKDKDGYGKFRYNGVQRPAHRIMYIIEFGRITEGLSVCHTCDNPSCVNPGHLWLGTTKENADDMVRKGRSLAGARNPHSGLKFEESSRYVDVPGEMAIEIVTRIRVKREKPSTIEREYPFSITVIRRLLRQFDGEEL